MSQHEISLTVNGRLHRGRVSARQTLVDFLRDELRPDRHSYSAASTASAAPARFCFDGAARTLLPDACGASRGHEVSDGRGSLRPSRAPELHRCRRRSWDAPGLQCGFCTPGMLITAHALLTNEADAVRGGDPRGARRESLPLHRLRADHRGGQARGRAFERPQSTRAAPSDWNRAFRYIAKKRRPKEDRRFLAGSGRFVADVALPGMLHVALVASPYPFARVRGIDAKAALALPGVRAVVTGADLAVATDPMMSGLDAPKLRRYPLAHGMTRYVGEWVAAVVGESRAIAEDAAELVEVDYESLTPVIDPELAILPNAPAVHPDHGSNVLFRHTWTWGPVAADFDAADHRLSLRARWHRSSTVPIETFGVVASWNYATQLLDVWASIQMPKYPDQLARALRMPGNAVRVHFDVDVGGSYGVKRGLKHSILTGYLARRLGVPVRLMEDRLENMRGGDAQGPDRIFDIEAAFTKAGIVRSLKIRALDDCGAHAGRAPLQLGKPVGAICGPYRVNSVEYEAISVTTNKTPQEAVRGFGQSPTNFALETTMDRIAAQLRMDRIELRRANLIRKEEFPYTIPSGSTYDSGDYHQVLEKALGAAHYAELLRRRDAARAAGKLAGIGVACCLEPSGGNSAFEPLFNPKNETTTWMEACSIKVDLYGAVVVSMNTSSSGQGHETLAATVVGEVLERDPETIRVVHADSLSALPSNSPVGSRMAIMLGGAAAGAAKKLKEAVIAIGAKKLGVAADMN